MSKPLLLAALVAAVSACGCAQEPTVMPATPSPTPPTPLVSVPIVSLLSPPRSCHVEITVRLDLGGFAAPSDVTVDWGDGAIEDLGQVLSANLTHTYATPGRIRITVSSVWLDGQTLSAETGFSCGSV